MAGCLPNIVGVKPTTPSQELHASGQPTPTPHQKFLVALIFTALLLETRKTNGFCIDKPWKPQTASYFLVTKWAYVHPAIDRSPEPKSRITEEQRQRLGPPNPNATKQHHRPEWDLTPGRPIRAPCPIFGWSRSIFGDGEIFESPGSKYVVSLLTKTVWFLGLCAT